MFDVFIQFVVFEKDLKEDFAVFIKTKSTCNGWKSVFLRGITGEVAECKILIGKYPKNTTKFGQAWSQFRKVNGFKVGQQLTFRFPDPSRNIAHLDKTVQG